MKIVCDNCSTKYSIADEKVRGKVFKIKCKKCSHIIVVKGQEVAGDAQTAGFDQKETKVFDYSGFEGQKDGPSADPIWHLVIDREQVGPLTVAELLQKWGSGEADVDTYAWREGFDDWKRLGAIEELATVLRRPEAAAEPARSANLFGGGATPTTDAGAPTTVSRTDPTDLFGGAGISTEDDAPSDLFGGGRPAPQPSVFASSAAPTAEKPMRRAPKEDQPLFSMAAAEGGGNGFGTDPVPKVDVRPMTAQRNENSVLFSLNNLTALASNAADPSPPKTSVGSSFSSSGPEGSGLIDIRAMAAMTLGGGKRERDEAIRSRAAEDDLPVFSTSSFSTPAAAVLLPTPQKQSTRGLYIIGAVLGVLVIAMIGVLLFLFLGGRRPAAEVTPPTSQPAVVPSTTAPAGTTTPPPASTSPRGTTTTSPPPSTTPPTTTSKPPAPTPPPPTTTTTPPPPPPAATTTPPAPPREDKHPPAPKHPVNERPPAPPVETAAPKPPVETVPRATEPPPSPVRPAKCDEVACLVTPDLPCCPKRGSATPSSRAPVTDSSLPDRLDQADIIAGMKNVNSRVLGCNDRAKGAGAFKVKVTVAPDGSVTSAAASPPVAGTAAASCVEGAVRGAKFKKTKSSITFNYPYTFH